MTLFFLHFEMYHQAQKHPIRGNIGLAYFLYMQLAGIVAAIMMYVCALIQHNVAGHDGPGYVWVPWGIGDLFSIVFRAALFLVPAMFLVSLLPYRYIKREMQQAEED